MSVRLIQGNCLQVLPTLDAQSVQTVVTSPPYFGLRDYGTPEQIGLEPTPQTLAAALVRVFREVWRVLRDDGTLWLNLGDSFGTGGSGQNFASSTGSTADSRTEIGGFGHVKSPGIRGMHKQLLGIPWRVAFALQEDGWYLRSDCIWHKPNPMPESVTDRPTKSHEYLFLLTKSAKYFYDADAVREPHLWAHDKRNNGERHAYKEGSKYFEADIAGKGRTRTDGVSFHPNGRNKRTVWTVATQPCSEAHFATFPPKLIEPCILAGSRRGDTVLDPFSGAGTTAMVASEHGRCAIGIELNPEYNAIAEKRVRNRLGMFAEVAP